MGLASYDDKFSTSLHPTYILKNLLGWKRGGGQRQIKIPGNSHRYIIGKHNTKIKQEAHGTHDPS